MYGNPLTKAFKALTESNASGQAVATGVYGPDGGWYYRYNAATKSIQRAKPAAGRSWEQVAKGSGAYNAILAMIPRLRRVPDAAVKALLASQSALSIVPTMTTTSTVAPMAVMQPAVAVPSSRPEWLIPAVVVGSATLILLFAFRPNKS